MNEAKPAAPADARKLDPKADKNLPQQICQSWSGKAGTSWPTKGPSWSATDEKSWTAKVPGQQGIRNRAGRRRPTSALVMKSTRIRCGKMSGGEDLRRMMTGGKRWALPVGAASHRLPQG